VTGRHSPRANLKEARPVAAPMAAGRTEAVPCEADSEAFKAGMRRLAASVTVLTCLGPSGTRHGMTATAICSVSADPPTLLCCINRSSATRELFIAAGSFAINVLSASDHEIATRFASRLPPHQRFSAGHWTSCASGAPLLESAIASFACRLSEVVEIGSHSVIFGEVVETRTRSEHVPPLLYAHGGYGRFAGAARAALPEMMWIPDWHDDF